MLRSEVSGKHGSAIPGILSLGVVFLLAGLSKNILCGGTEKAGREDKRT